MESSSIGAFFLAGHAHAGGRAPGVAASALDASAPRGCDSLDEARRWIGQGNPTPFREAWCRDLVNIVLERIGHPLADRSHLAIAVLRLGPSVREPRPGDLAVMSHHVTFFAGWDGDGAFLGLGATRAIASA